MKFLTAFIISFTGLYAFGQQTTIQMSSSNNNQTFNTCNGFIIDSGGQGGPGYGNNETVVVTICPGTPGDIVSIIFNLFQLSTVDDNPLANVTNLDYMDVYDGNSTSAPTLGTYSGSQLQGVVINATALNTTGCITLRFRSNTTGTGMFTASATCDTPCATPSAGGVIVGGTTSDSTRVCVGELVNFANSGSAAAPGFTLQNYEWDFMDGTQATGQNVTHAFDTPGQYLVQLFVTDDNGCGNTNLIDLQVFVATIPDFTGFPGDTTLCLGESVSFTADPESYEVLWDGFTGSQSITDGCLPDTLLGVSQDIQIMQTGFNPGATITQLSDVQSLCLELEHSFMGDLVILVTCPNGQSQILHQQGGGGTQIGIPNQLDNVDCSDPSTQGTPFTYCFTPTAPLTWVGWVNANGFAGTLPAGNYAPVQSFTNLIGCPLNGVWTLTVIDNWAADDGTLFSFDINLNPALYPPVTVFTPQIGHAMDSSYWTTPALYATVSSNGDVLNVVPTAAGTQTYVYNVIDDFGCHHDTSVTVTINANPQADAGPDVVACNGSAVQLNGMVAGGALSCDYAINLVDAFGDGWNGNNLLVTVNGVQTSYTIAFGANSNYSVTIPHGATVTVQFDGAGSWTTECSYEIIDPNGNIALADGGNFVAPSTAVQTFVGDCFGGLDFVWSPSSVVSDPSIPNPVGTFNGSGTLTLTVYPTGHPLCATSDQLNFSVSASANPGTNNLLTICSQGAPADLFPLLGPNASPNGTWTNAANQPVIMPYNPVTMNPGLYTYTVDSNGCTSFATITVSEINTTVNAVPTNVSCHGANNGSAVISVTNATTYSVDGGASQPIGASPFTVTNLAPGNHVVDVMGANGCNGSINFTITEPPALAITSISPGSTICPNTNTVLTATGTGGSSPYTYSWIANNTIVGVGSTITVAPSITTQYCVILSEACGSTPDTSCTTITITNPLTINWTPDRVNGCEPVPVNFTNSTTGGIVVSSTVDFGDGTSATTLGLAGCSHTYETPGVYTVTVTSISDIGCTYVQTYSNLIHVFNNPIANFNITPNPATMFNPQVNLLDGSTPDVVGYNWQIQDGTPAQSTEQNVHASFPDGVPGNYLVTLYVVNQDGCLDSVSRIVQVVSEVILYAPNSFTPDGDEFNQQWFVYIDGIDIAQFDLFIYNRWGEIVWENHDPTASWDGTYQGKVVQEGTYTWTIETKDLTNDKKYTFNGHLTVLK
jgi:gliding motility-associated-like protein